MQGQNSTSDGCLDILVFKNITITQCSTKLCVRYYYTLFHKTFRIFCYNIIGLPEHRNKRKNILFLNSNYKIIEHEMNKMAIHTHVIFRPLNAMFSLSNTYVFLEWQ